MKSILLTGASGFFGRHIKIELERRGYAVEAPSHEAFDLRQERDIERMFASTKSSTIIHCAAHCGGIGLNKARPAELFYDNALMGILLMDLACGYGINKFIQLGTVCEYPKFATVPFSEDKLWDGYPEETNAPYGIAKKALLVMGQAYRQQYGFNAIHLLPVNLYGPHDNFDPKSSHVIPALIRKLVEAQGQPTVKIWGSGKAYREFLYVEDAAEAVTLATELYNGAEPVNIGTGVTISIAHLAEMIAYKVGYKGEIQFDATMPDGQPERCLNTRRAAQEFGFTARTTLSEGLDKTISWYRSNVSS